MSLQVVHVLYPILYMELQVCQCVIMIFWPLFPLRCYTHPIRVCGPRQQEYLPNFTKGLLLNFTSKYGRIASPKSTLYKKNLPTLENLHEFTNLTGNTQQRLFVFFEFFLFPEQLPNQSTRLAWSRFSAQYRELGDPNSDYCWWQKSQGQPPWMVLKPL